MKTEVIIASRCEPDLLNTVANIRDNSGCSVRVIEDEEGRGPQAMRHAGIMASDADAVIIMDGHMRVKKGALDAAAEYIGARGRKVACLRCHHTAEEDWSSKPYGGATLQMKAYGKDANEPQAFVAKWRKSPECGKIGAVMGACYVFRRDWYLDGLQGPWQAGTGWGCDEEILSAATWLRGGEVELLPFEVWHQARKAGGQPFRYTQAQIVGLYANRLRLLLMLPMPMEQRNELVQHIMPSLRRGVWEKVANLVETEASFYTRYRQFLAAGGLSWGEFETQVIGKETVKMPSMMELREQARAAGITVPFGCKKADLVEMLANPPESETPATGGAEAAKEPPKGRAKPQSRANWGVNELNGRKTRGCTHCGGSNTTTVRTRPKVGKLTIRDRKCLSCGRNFTTREVSE